MLVSARTEIVGIYPHLNFPFLISLFLAFIFQVSCCPFPSSGLTIFFYTFSALSSFQNHCSGSLIVYSVCIQHSFINMLNILICKPSHDHLLMAIDSWSILLPVKMWIKQRFPSYHFELHVLSCDNPLAWGRCYLTQWHLLRDGI